MNSFAPADTLHRLVKQALDSGAASSIDEAQALFSGYRIKLTLDDPVSAADANHQAALITTIALARRVFLGGVHVRTVPNVPFVCPLPFGKTLADAVAAAGATLGPVSSDLPLIEIGGGPQARRHLFHVRPVFGGWRGGVVPVDSSIAMDGFQAMPLSPMLAAAVAVSEAFFHVAGGSVMAGRRPIGLSLWDPRPEIDWLVPTIVGPKVDMLPSQLWLIGLGHLGQAFLWALGLLPYARPGDVRLYLQDIDTITPSTESTSVLSDSHLVGEEKVRAMAAWAKRRGFKAAIQERRFATYIARQPDEPGVALCGIDNALGRQTLDRVGFDFIVEAGLGRGHSDFRSIRLHTLPASRSAADIWRSNHIEEVTIDRPAYERLLGEGKLDKCGVTLLAGKAVGAPFVGAVAACLALSELLRLLHGGLIFELIDLDLKAPEHRVAVPNSRDFSTFNPGFAPASSVRN